MFVNKMRQALPACLNFVVYFNFNACAATYFFYLGIISTKINSIQDAPYMTGPWSVGLTDVPGVRSHSGQLFE